MFENITTEDLKRMTETEGLIFQGCGGDLNEWVSKVNEMFTENGVLLNGDTFNNVFVFQHEGLTDMLFIMKDVELDIRKLTMWRLQTHGRFGGTWLSDFLNNQFGINSNFDFERIEKTATLSAKAPPNCDDMNGLHSKDIKTNHSLQVHIDLYDKSFGGFTIPLPTTPETMKPFLENIDITHWQDVKICEVFSEIDGLGEMLTRVVSMESSTALDELNYLSAKIAAMDEHECDIFCAALETGKHGKSIAEVINITENLDCFCLQPVYNTEQYGEHIITMHMDETADVVKKLMLSDDPKERVLAEHIVLLEKHIDYDSFGIGIASEESGVFTEMGYITKTTRLSDIYHGLQDIPDKYRLLPKSNESIWGFEETPERVMVQNTDLSALLLEMHAVCGDYMCDAKYNVALMKNCDEFFVLDKGCMLMVYPANLLYYSDTYEHELWQSLTDSPDYKAYFMSVESRENGQVIGSLYEAEVSSIQDSIQTLGIDFTHIDAEMKDGTNCSFTHAEWKSMEQLERDQLKSCVKHYSSSDKALLSSFTSNLGSLLSCKSIHDSMTTHEFLHRINKSYMDKAANKKTGMIRITLDVARELLTQNESDVYRMTAKGTEKLLPLDAVKTGLWYSFDREFAIKPNDLKGLEKWAKRTAGDFIQQAKRSRYKKGREEAL